jgi:hypothetical protein
MGSTGSGGEDGRFAREATAMRWLWIGYCVATAAYLAFVVMSGDEPRGSDQWWYAREAQTVIDGQTRVSNEVYPYPFLQNHRVDNPFIHHTLSLYFVAAAGKILGVARGWQAMNVLAMIVAAACTAMIVQSIAQRRGAAFFTYAVFLLNPLTVWQSMNLLMDVFYSMFVALAAMQYILAGTCRLRWTLLCVTLCIAAQCHPVFVPFLLGLPFAFIFHAGKPVQPRNVAIAMGFLFLGWLAIAVSKLLFNSALFPTLLDGIRCCIPGKGVMEYYFDLDPRAVDIHLLWAKFLWAMKSQFLLGEDAMAAPLFWFYDLTAVGSLALLAVALRDSRAKRERQLAILACCVFAMHMAFISIHHAQPRVCLVFLAPQLACAAVVATKIRPLTGPVLAAGFSVVMVLFLCVDVMAVGKVRGDAAVSQYEQEALVENITMIPSEDRVMHESTGGMGYQPVTYALHPRRTLVLAPEHRYPKATYQRLEDLFQAEWLICRSSSPLPVLLSAEAIPLKTPFRGKTSDLAIYRLRPEGNAGICKNPEQ